MTREKELQQRGKTQLGMNSLLFISFTVIYNFLGFKRVGKIFRKAPSKFNSNLKWTLFLN